MIKEDIVKRGRPRKENKTVLKQRFPDDIYDKDINNGQLEQDAKEVLGKTELQDYTETMEDNLKILKRTQKNKNKLKVSKKVYKQSLEDDYKPGVIDSLLSNYKLALDLTFVLLMVLLIAIAFVVGVILKLIF